MDSNIFISEEEKRRHYNVIRALALEFGITEFAASVLYEDELRGFGTRARIRDYLPVLVARHVKEIIRFNGRDHQGWLGIKH